MNSLAKLIAMRVPKNTHVGGAVAGGAKSATDSAAAVPTEVLTSVRSNKIDGTGQEGTWVLWRTQVGNSGLSSRNFYLDDFHALKFAIESTPIQHDEGDSPAAAREQQAKELEFRNKLLLYSTLKSSPGYAAKMRETGGKAFGDNYQNLPMKIFVKEVESSSDAAPTSTSSEDREESLQNLELSGMREYRGENFEPGSDIVAAIALDSPCLIECIGEGGIEVDAEVVQKATDEAATANAKKDGDGVVAAQQSVDVYGESEATWTIRFDAGQNDFSKCFGGSDANTPLISTPFRLHHVLLGDFWLELHPNTPYPNFASVLFKCGYPGLVVQANVSVVGASAPDADGVTTPVVYCEKTITSTGQTPTEEDMKAGAFLSANFGEGLAASPSEPTCWSGAGEIMIMVKVDRILQMPSNLKENL